MEFAYVNCTFTTLHPLGQLQHKNQIIVSHRNVPLRAPTSLRPVLQRRARSRECLPVRVSNFAASAAKTSTNGAITGRKSLTATGGDESGALMLSRSSDAMEQLDIERGVCIPFRKYTPETV